MMEKQKILYLTHEEALQTEIALESLLKLLLEEYEQIQGTSGETAAMRIIRSHRAALEKVKDVNRQFRNEIEDL